MPLRKENMPDDHNILYLGSNHMKNVIYLETAVEQAVLYSKYVCISPPNDHESLVLKMSSCLCVCVCSLPACGILAILLMDFHILLCYVDQIDHVSHVPPCPWLSYASCLLVCNSVRRGENLFPTQFF